MTAILRRASCGISTVSWIRIRGCRAISTAIRAWPKIEPPLPHTRNSANLCIATPESARSCERIRDGLFAPNSAGTGVKTGETIGGTAIMIVAAGATVGATAIVTAMTGADVIEITGVGAIATVIVIGMTGVGVIAIVIVIGTADAIGTTETETVGGTATIGAIAIATATTATKTQERHTPRAAVYGGPNVFCATLAWKKNWSGGERRFSAASWMLLRRTPASEMLSSVTLLAPGLAQLVCLPFASTYSGCDESR